MDMNKLKVFIAGQKYFAAEVFKQCLNADLTVVGVCAPASDNYLRTLANSYGVPVVTPMELTPKAVIGADLGICAHYFGAISEEVRSAATHGWIGYHPSLLPRHRGKSSIEWALKMRDFITGGSVYWLSEGMDEGDIANQDYCFIDPALYALDSKKAAAILWRDKLAPMGLSLIGKTVNNIMWGKINRRPQESAYATIEPSL